MASSVCLCIYIIININNENVSLNCKKYFSKMQIHFLLLEYVLQENTILIYFKMSHFIAVSF